MNAAFDAIKRIHGIRFYHLKPILLRSFNTLSAEMDTTLLPNLTSSNCSLAPPGARFNIAACYNRTVGCSFFPNVPIEQCEAYCGTSFGYRNPLDVLGAFTTWVIPLFGLVANMHFAESTLHGLVGDQRARSSITKNRSLQWLLPKHFVFSVQLANPIGTIWSLADKVYLSQYLWNRCERIEDDTLDIGHGANARRDIANVCNAL